MQMNLFIFNFKSKKTKAVYLIILSLLIFTFLDRFTYLSFQKLSSYFYNIPIVNFNDLKISKKEKEFYNTLIFGSSRTKQGIHPWYLKELLGLNSYKVSRAGTYFKYNYHFYSIYKNKFKVPAYVIYGVDYFIFKQMSSRRKMNSLLGRNRKKQNLTNTDLNSKHLFLLHFPSILLAKKKNIETFFVDVIDYLTSRKKKSERPLISNFKGKKKQSLMIFKENL